MFNKEKSSSWQVISLCTQDVYLSLSSFDKCNHTHKHTKTKVIHHPSFSLFCIYSTSRHCCIHQTIQRRSLAPYVIGLYYMNTICMLIHNLLIFSCPRWTHSTCNVWYYIRDHRMYWFSYYVLNTVEIVEYIVYLLKGCQQAWIKSF